MPKSYNEKERTAIIAELRRVAFESMIQKGIKKTTVDDLVSMVHIPKGTFYLFYNSKELLLYDALMQKEAEVHVMLSEKLTKIKGDFTVDTLAEMLYDFFQFGFSIGIVQLMLNGDMNILLRKLPDEIVEQHISKDDEFLSIFRELFPAMKPEKLKNYSAAFRAIFFTASYQREIGEHYDYALNLLIKGLVMQMWEDNK